jgi:hypothetical protein
MPVIINDFEVVVEPKPKNSSQPGETQSNAGTTALITPRPEDIEQIMRRLSQRRARLRAD